MKRIINIDWLSLYCINIQGYGLVNRLAKLGLSVSQRNVETRHFSILYDVHTTDNEKLLELQCDPKSLKTQGGIWLPGSVMVKIGNKHLYDEKTIERVYSLLNKVGLEVRSISRLDIAMDLERFDNGWLPQTLIKKFFKDEVWFMGNKKFSAIGRQKSSIQYEYIRFGSGASAYSVYLYNKSKELEEIKDKPYIRQIWRDTGMDEGKVWRLEISLRSDAKHIIQTDDVIIKSGGKLVNKTTSEVLPEGSIVKEDSKGVLRHIIPITLDSIMDKESVMSLYSKLIANVFNFRKKEGNKKKQKCENIELVRIEEGDKNYRPIHLTYSTDSGRTERLVRKYLDELAKEFPDVLKPVYEVQKEMQKKHGFKANATLTGHCKKTPAKGGSINNKQKKEMSRKMITEEKMLVDRLTLRYLTQLVQLPSESIIPFKVAISSQEVIDEFVDYVERNQTFARKVVATWLSVEVTIAPQKEITMIERRKI